MQSWCSRRMSFHPNKRNVVEQQSVGSQCQLQNENAIASMESSTNTTKTTSSNPSTTTSSVLLCPVTHNLPMIHCKDTLMNGSIAILCWALPICSSLTILKIRRSEIGDTTSGAVWIASSKESTTCPAWQMTFPTRKTPATHRILSAKLVSKQLSSTMSSRWPQLIFAWQICANVVKTSMAKRSSCQDIDIHLTSSKFCQSSSAGHLTKRLAWDSWCQLLEDNHLGNCSRLAQQCSKRLVFKEFSWMSKHWGRHQLGSDHQSASKHHTDTFWVSNWEGVQNIWPQWISCQHSVWCFNQRQIF